MPDTQSESYDAQLLEALRAELAPAIEIVRRLGAGGMGTVFLGRDVGLKRLVAIKTLAPELARDPASRTRFEREAEAVAAIAHPNVVAVYSVGELASGVPYFVMQYVSGRSCSERLETDGAFDVETTKRILGEVASALAAAHRIGIIHRDIKPANILIEDATGRVVVSDFGIAAVKGQAQDPAAMKITQTGTSIGTPAYMSPEQLLAEPVTEKTDIYSLGLLGYELLTQRGAYGARSPADLMAAHLRDAPIRLSEVLQHVDPEFEALLEGCLAKRAEQRPSAAEVAKRLAGGSDRLLEWPPPGLESVHGRLAPATGFLAAGSLMLGIPLLTLASFDRGMVTMAAFFTSVLTVIGAVTFITGSVLLLLLLLRAIRGVRAGHGWLTAIETAADHGGNTGLLIAGAREFAPLSPSERALLRQRRLAASGLFLAAALTPVTGFLVALPFFTRSGAAIALLALIATATLGCGLAGATLERLERRRLQDPRRRLQAPLATGHVLTRHAASWRESFEQVRQGQGIGRGRVPRIAAITAVAVAGFCFLVLTSTIGYVLVAATTLSQQASGSELQAWTMFGVRRRSADGMERYALPTDPSITPERAGEALQAIDDYRPTQSGPSRSPWERPIRRPISGRATQSGYGRNTLFPDNKQDGYWVDAALRQARAGFTPAQRRLLLEEAANPLQAEFAVLEHASRADYELVAWPLPVPDSLRLDELPFVRSAQIKEAAYAEVARAALDLSDGRAQAAEERLRRIINAGLVLLTGRTVMENLLGSVVVAIARNDLEILYEETGRAREARAMTTVVLNAYQNSDQPNASLTGQVIAMAASVLSEDAHIRATRETMRSPLTMAGLRWGLALYQMPRTQCSDLHQLLFGPDASYRQTYADARSTMVTSQTDSVIFAMGERGLERLVRDKPGYSPTPGVRAMRASARAFDVLIGGHRVQSCVNWLTEPRDG